MTLIDDSDISFQDGLARLKAEAFRPPPDLNLVEWADSYRQLSTESSNIGGRWRTSRFEVARGPMLATTERGVDTITCMVATQTLKTELLLNVIGYHAHLDPCPMMYVAPKEDSARIFSKERLAPMARTTPALKALSDDRVRGGRDTIFYKEFPGGFLAMAYAGSPTELAMRPIRITLLDEIDKYEGTKEGDPVLLAEERTATFRSNRLRVRCCSPTWEETSRIYNSYLASDMRKPFVCCPLCDHWQTLDFFKNVHWQKNDQGEHFPMTAAIYCESCGLDDSAKPPRPIPGKEWSEAQRLRMVTTESAIRWMQTKPFTCCGVLQDPAKTRNWEWDEAMQVGYACCSECHERAVANHHAGFQASKLYSPVSTVIELAAKWVDCKDDPESKQVFYNTQLGIPFQLQAMRKIESHSLTKRKHKFEATVPDGGLVLTAGVDVQYAENRGRLEIETVAWGDGYESWSVDYKIIEGDPTSPALWKQLDEYFLTTFIDAKGRPRRIEAACIDTGGSSTEAVYKYCAARMKSNIWGIKGRSEKGGVWDTVWPAPVGYNPKKSKQVSYRPVSIGVNAAKEAIREFLLVEAPGPGYCHFPHDRPENYFHQLTVEKLVLEYKAGRAVKKWQQPKGAANEALDARVYSYAALRGLMMNRKFTFAKRIESLAAFDAESAPKPVVVKPLDPGARPANPRVHPSKFMA